MEHRCKNGTRRNKTSHVCEPYPDEIVPIANLTPRTRNARIIQQFMKKTKHKRIAVFLNALCNDSGVCIAFGKELKKIKDFFRNFSLDYIKESIKRIGTVSYNGFVNELKFTHKGYSSYAILKSSNSENTSNLMYEYRVGQFLNKMSLQFPCFVETYKLLKYTTNHSWKLARDSTLMDASVFKKCVVTQEYSLKEACKSHKRTALLIQHLKDVVPIKHLFKSTKGLDYDLISTLYQVYFVLDLMKDVFTHYDLHDENVLLYEPSKTKYIEYHYHTPSEVVQFKSIYIAKIIDYGGCYFKEGAYSSKELYDEVCKEPECNKTKSKCGSSNGFITFIDDPGSMYLSYVSNKSSDLWLIVRLFSVFRRPYREPLKEIVKVLSPTTIAFVSEVFYHLDYEGIEQTCDAPTICDVTDMKNVLEKYAKISLLDSEFDRYYPERTKLGDMHVYSDGRPLEFKESV